MGILINIFFVFLLPIAAFAFIMWLIITLQIFLSGMNSRIPGLIIPLISFIVATLFSIILWSLDGETNTKFLIGSLIVCNIPTLVYLFINHNVRKNK